MSYQGFGYVLTIGTPIGDQKFSLPIEQLAKDAGNMAIQAAWPPLKAQLEAEMPVLIDKLKAEVPGLLQTAQNQLVTKTWPALQPKVRAELNYGISEGKKIAFGVGSLIVASIFVAAIWSKKKS